MAPAQPKRRRAATKAPASNAAALADEKKLDAQIRAEAEEKAAGDEKAKTEQRQKGVNRRKSIQEQRTNAVVQAAVDGRKTPEDPDISLKKGSTPSLHVLNTRAKLASYAERDVAREAANAAAKASYDVLRGKSKGASADGIARRFRTQNAAQIEVAKAAAVHAANQGN